MSLLTWTVWHMVRVSDDYVMWMVYINHLMSFGGFLTHNYFWYCKFYNFVLCIVLLNLHSVYIYNTQKFYTHFDNMKPIVTLSLSHTYSLKMADLG
jgi:hypothetical protein